MRIPLNRSGPVRLILGLFTAAAISAVASSRSPAQTILGLKAIGNGERVRLSYKGKSKAVNLEKDFAGTFVPGGNPPHSYTVLLSVERNSHLYLVAKFRSRSPMSDPMGPCGGDTPSTLLLIKANKALKVEELASEVYDSCAFNGGRYLKGQPRVTKNAVTIDFEERGKRYTLKFDANDADKGLQVSEQSMNCLNQLTTGKGGNHKFFGQSLIWNQLLLATTVA